MKIQIFVLLTFLPLIGCRNVSNVIDDIPVPKPSQLGKLVPGSVPPASMFKNFIRSAGKSAGESYIANQVSNNLPVSHETLSEVIFQTSLEELRKTGEAVRNSYIRDMRNEAFALAAEMINQYNNENNSQAETAE